MTDTISDKSEAAVAPGASRLAHRVEADVAIVGGGMSGAAAAAALGRLGISIALIDVHAIVPHSFRAEKVAGDQISLLERLGLLETVIGVSTFADHVINLRAGRIVDQYPIAQYGFFYADVVNAVRAQLPANVEVLIGRVADIETGRDRQKVTLSDGTEIGARLVVLATGMMGGLRDKLGLSRRLIWACHSLSIGFSMRPQEGRIFGFSSLTCYGDRIEDQIDYVAFLPIGETMRANLFCYRDPREAWARRFLKDPRGALFDSLPHLEAYLGAFETVKRTEMCMVDRFCVENPLRDGIVVIGDAYSTSCPAVGSGFTRLLTDVERLRDHLPQWLASPGAGSDKIAAFYGDPVKKAAEDAAAQWAEHRRTISTDRSLFWELRRRQHFLRRRMRNWLARPAPRAAAPGGATNAADRHQPRRAKQ